MWGRLLELRVLRASGSLGETAKGLGVPGSSKWRGPEVAQGLRRGLGDQGSGGVRADPLQAVSGGWGPQGNAGRGPWDRGPSEFPPGFSARAPRGLPARPPHLPGRRAAAQGSRSRRRLPLSGLLGSSSRGGRALPALGGAGGERPAGGGLRAQQGREPAPEPEPTPRRPHPRRSEGPGAKSLLRARPPAARAGSAPKPTAARRPRPRPRSHAPSGSPAQTRTRARTELAPTTRRPRRRPAGAGCASSLLASAKWAQAHFAGTRRPSAGARKRRSAAASRARSRAAWAPQAPRRHSWQGPPAPAPALLFPHPSLKPRPPVCCFVPPSPREPGPCLARVRPGAPEAGPEPAVSARCL